MKLRIKGDSIRLRLTQSEVARLVQEGRVEEAVRFGPGRRLRYALALSAGADRLAARFDGELLTVLLPEAWGRDWAEREQVGFEGVQAIDGEAALTLLVEKDFQCLHRRPDEADAFPHPQAESGGAGTG